MLAMPRVLLKLSPATTTFLTAQRREAKFYPLLAAKGLITIPHFTDKKAEACRGRAGGRLPIQADLGCAPRTPLPGSLQTCFGSPSLVGWAAQASYRTGHYVSSCGLGSLDED